MDVACNVDVFFALAVVFMLCLTPSHVSHSASNVSHYDHGSNMFVFQYFCEKKHYFLSCLEYNHYDDLL